MTKAQIELLVFMAQIVSEHMFNSHRASQESKNRLDGLIESVRKEPEYYFNVAANRTMEKLTQK